MVVYISALLTLWSIARQYDRPAGPGQPRIAPARPALGGWDLAP
jgi:hypothetical protein